MCRPRHGVAAPSHSQRPEANREVLAPGRRVSVRETNRAIQEGNDGALAVWVGEGWVVENRLPGRAAVPGQSGASHGAAG